MPLLMAMLLVFLGAQLATGLAEFNEQQREHHQPAVSMAGYLGTGHPWEALFENWESEFPQMAVFVFLTTVLIQKGSPESRRPHVKELVDVDPRGKASFWPLRRWSGWRCISGSGTRLNPNLFMRRTMKPATNQCYLPSLLITRIVKATTAAISRAGLDELVL